MLDQNIMSINSETNDSNGDGEGVWSPDIEQAFQEALLMYPPCGRRKTILQGEGGGKMWGRNELIAKHIEIKTGKRRSRKQVSSHIQVLARRRSRAEGGSRGTGGDSNDSGSPASSINGGGSSSIGFGRTSRPDSAMSGIQYQIETPPGQQTLPLLNGLVGHLGHAGANAAPVAANNFYDIWSDRPIATQKIRLVEFSAFIENRNSNPNHHQMISDGSSNSNSPQAPIDNYANNNGQYGNNTHRSSTSSSAFSSQQHLQSARQQQQQQHHHHHHHHQQQQLATATQFNQANAYSHHHHHQQNTGSATTNNGLLLMTAQQQQPSTTTRHSFIEIDYRKQQSRTANQKLEEIAINQIQDKFPDIGDHPGGLFQRGPADAFFLVKFWANLEAQSPHNELLQFQFEDQNSYLGFSSHFETLDFYKDITLSTKACSYGMQVVEKVEKIYGAFNSSTGRYSYDVDRSPMCEFMTQFIKKLSQLPTTNLMNSVLENFTVLQVVTSDSTSEILLCLAYVFEIEITKQIANGSSSHYHVYKLSKGCSSNSAASTTGDARMLAQSLTSGLHMSTAGM